MAVAPAAPGRRPSASRARGRRWARSRSGPSAARPACSSASPAADAPAARSRTACRPAAPPTAAPAAASRPGVADDGHRHHQRGPADQVAARQPGTRTPRPPPAARRTAGRGRPRPAARTPSPGRPPAVPPMAAMSLTLAARAFQPKSSRPTRRRSACTPATTGVGAQQHGPSDRHDGRVVADQPGRRRRDRRRNCSISVQLARYRRELPLQRSSGGMQGVVKSYDPGTARARSSATPTVPSTSWRPMPSPARCSGCSARASG